LIGAPLGAFVVNGAKSWFTVALPDFWLYVLGVLFIVVTLFFPAGIVGGAQPSSAGGMTTRTLTTSLAVESEVASPTAEESRVTPAPADRGAAEAEAPAKPADAKGRKRFSLLPKRKVVDQHRIAALTKNRRALLCVDSVSVSFDGFKALSDLTLVLDEGELRCLIGPNGAGKTTLMDVITGKTKPDTGSVFLVGDDSRSDQSQRVRDRAARSVPQVPASHGISGPHRVREPRARAAEQKGRLSEPFRAFSKAENERIDKCSRRSD
jgi:ABC-type glutathione transport system ATPase component